MRLALDERASRFSIEGILVPFVEKVNLSAKGAVVVEEGYGNPDVDYTAMLVELERLGIKTVGLSDECTGRDGNSGGWEGCINPDGSFVMENNGMFCANHISGYSRRTCADF